MPHCLFSHHLDQVCPIASHDSLLQKSIQTSRSGTMTFGCSSCYFGPTYPMDSQILFKNWYL
ncbi:hypothetical protein DAI22_12g110101 [Oryza sativa Japonica Group]|nr:hypothetical protein DAI22_12g110101 [Oryza sativa Japonica Group]